MLYPFPFWVRRRKAETEGKGAEGVAWWGRVWRQQEGREKRGDSDLAAGAPAAGLTREARVSLTALEGQDVTGLSPSCHTPQMGNGWPGSGEHYMG